MIAKEKQIEILEAWHDELVIQKEEIESEIDEMQQEFDELVTKKNVFMMMETSFHEENTRVKYLEYFNAESIDDDIESLRKEIHQANRRLEIRFLEGTIEEIKQQIKKVKR